MTCQDSANITIEFPKTGLELRPYTVDFRIDRRELDFLDAKFSKEVGDYLAQFTSQKDHAMRKPQYVEVKLNGVVTHRLFYRPDFVTYGETNTWIEFHDPLKIFEYDIVDYKTDSLTVEGVYSKLIEEANTFDIITDYNFQVPGDTETTAGDYVVGGPGGISLLGSKKESTFFGSEILVNLWRDYDEEFEWEPDKQTSKISETVFRNLDIQNKTALEALYKLNQKLGFVTWVDRDGVLNIGLDFLEPNHHVAHPNDDRVWIYRNANITPPGSPVKMAVVNGGMIDAPNQTEEENYVDSIFDFVNPTSSHEEDLVAQGVAKRPDIIDGKIVSVDEPNLARDALTARAKEVLANEVTNNNSGSVTINIERSGDRVSDWRSIEVGDFITLIPSEGDDCNSIEQDTFLISGVKHDVDGGDWKLKLKIQKWDSINIEPQFRYFSPDSNNYYNDDYEQIYTDT